MPHFKQILNIILTRQFFKKLIAYSILLFFIYFFRDFLGIFLLTFIFAYLFLSLSRFLKFKLDLFISNHEQNYPKVSLLKTISKVNLFVVFVYLFFVWVITFVLSDLIPKLTIELWELSTSIPFLSNYFQNVAEYLQIVREWYTEIGWTVEEIIVDDNYDLIFSIFEQLKSVSLVFLQVVLALVMSFIFVIDRDNFYGYLRWIKNSNFKFLYKEYKIIFNKIIKSFGLILKAQSMIAVINMFITIVWFYIIGTFYGGFPYILTLAIIVFLFSYIPVLGMWISWIPLSIVAYLSWWFPAMFFVILMIFTTSALEAYYLNPKIVSSYFKLPISLTFIILVVSEYIFWIAGLLIWVSLFYFILGLLWDFDRLVTKNKKKFKKEEKSS